MRPERSHAMFAVFWALLALLACANPAAAGSVLDPRGPDARRIASLGTFLLTMFGAVTLVMIVLVVWGALRRRGTLDRRPPHEMAGGMTWIAIGGIGVPAIVLAVTFFAGLRTLNAFPMHHPDPASVHLVGHQWWWEVRYVDGAFEDRFTTANEIHIPAGQPVDVTLESADVIHSLWIPQLQGKVDLVPGETNHIRLQADRPGRYHGQCAEYCGQQHAHMQLDVRADAPSEFADWVTSQRAPASAPGDSVTMRGQALFERAACGLCHTVRGTAAQGKVGPDLTHLASRGTIAAGSFPNDVAHLSAWVTHAQSLKPGCQMPDLATFTGSELRDIVAYLQALR